MKKYRFNLLNLVLFFLFLFSIFSKSSASMEASLENSLIKERKSSDNVTYDFLDKKGKVLRSVKRYEKPTETSSNGLKQIHYHTFLPFDNFYVEEEWDRNLRSKKQYQTDGVSENVVNNIKVFDLDGRLIFEKIKVPFKFYDISENGKTIVCQIERPDFEGDPQKLVTKKAPNGEVYVFSANGKELYSEELSENYSGACFYVSPSGKWFASCKVTRIDVVDLGKNENHVISSSEFKFSESDVNGVDDLGNLISKKVKRTVSDKKQHRAGLAEIKILYKLVK